MRAICILAAAILSGCYQDFSSVCGNDDYLVYYGFVIEYQTINNTSHPVQVNVYRCVSLADMINNGTMPVAPTDRPL